MVYFFVFIFGLTIGSFINVIVYRLNKKQSIIKGRSYCPHCKKLIKWYDNIPLLSFFLLGGKCRSCQKKISWQYPLIELATAIIFLITSLVVLRDISAINSLIVLKLLAYLVFSAFLIIIFVYDLKYYQILDRIVLPLVALAFFYNLLFNYSFINLLIAGIIGLGFFLIQYVFSHGQWVGDGDLRMGLSMGFILGFPKIFLAIFVAYFLGSIIAVFLLIFGKKSFKSRIPFGPFLALGTYLIMLFGDFFLDKYFRL